MAKRQKVEGIQLSSGFWYPYKTEGDRMFLSNKKVSKSGEVMIDQTMIVPKDKYDEHKKIRRTR